MHDGEILTDGHLNTIDDPGDLDGGRFRLQILPLVGVQRERMVRWHTFDHVLLRRLVLLLDYQLPRNGV